MESPLHPEKALVPKRIVFVTGTFLLSVLLYVDRVCISAAQPNVVADLGLTDTEMGWVLSVFALGYALFQTPSGMLADRFGPRRILTAVVTFWSIFTALTGTAFNYVSMLIYRFLFGVGEAGAFPGMARAVFSWIPMKERGLITGINFSGSRLGAAFALPVVAWMIESIGWRSSFGVLGGIGFVWALVWYAWFRDDPVEHKGISKKELDYILVHRQQVEQGSPDRLSAGQLLSSKNMWLAMAQYFASNFTFFFTLTWLFPHIKSEYGLETVEAAFYASAPLVAGAFGNWFSGWLVDRIYNGGQWRRSRMLPAVIGFALAAGGLIGSVYMSEVGGAVFFLSIAIFGADMTLSPSWSFCVDIGRKNAGAVSGTMNMAGNLGSFVTALAFPYLQAWTDSTTPFFFVGAMLNGIAILAWLGMRPDPNLEDY
jgi:ACS family glucarate transporter-like MFS transporter